MKKEVFTLKSETSFTELIDVIRTREAITKYLEDSEVRILNTLLDGFDVYSIGTASQLDFIALQKQFLDVKMTLSYGYDPYALELIEEMLLEEEDE